MHVWKYHNEILLLQLIYTNFSKGFIDNFSGEDTKAQGS
jgi:hypothetical protein